MRAAGDEVELNERQLEAFKLMYQDPWNYPMILIAERFGISLTTAETLGRKLGLTRTYVRDGFKQPGVFGYKRLNYKFDRT